MILVILIPEKASDVCGRANCVRPYVFKGIVSGIDNRYNVSMKNIVFIDSEIVPRSGEIADLGAVKPSGSWVHTASQPEFTRFVAGAEFVCGHNIVAHDAKYIGHLLGLSDDQADGASDGASEEKLVGTSGDTSTGTSGGTSDEDTGDSQSDRLDNSAAGGSVGPPLLIDTLLLSPLLYPQRPYHALLKDDKLLTDERNNPLNDAKKTMALFFDEVNQFKMLDKKIRKIYCALLDSTEGFHGFFRYNNSTPHPITERAVKSAFDGKLCMSADISALMENNPVELAYTLALIGTGDRYSVTPPWVLKNYPQVDSIMKLLRNTPCAHETCRYCKKQLDIHSALKRIFNYDGFRTYDDEPLQESAVDSAVHGKSLLAIFPTGGGKSVTFQLPALMAGEAVHGLTVVISPLQSLMKDQVDNLEQSGIVDAVTVNGLLNQIERSEALRRVESGLATILYISPEQLRSATIERLLLSRNIARFVIDEAHCLSAWGQDFRVDYLYIGDFIRELQKKKGRGVKIPVSCFTATAKQKVISDIRDYFKKKLRLDLALFATNATRENLRYAVLYKETDEEKYTTLRTLIQERDCPVIVYVSRTRRTWELAERLTSDGFPARPFNGKMEPNDKILNQEAFIHDEFRVIVATSAFGMGVDKKNVGLVVHYDISDSLENYVQEAGRAGRDSTMRAECYVLFNEGDLDKHFILLNQTKLSMSEIQQVWRAIKGITRSRNTVCRSALEIARQAGWNDSGSDVETRVRTAVAALENAGYVERGKNVPHIYATGIIANNM